MSDIWTKVGEEDISPGWVITQRLMPVVGFTSDPDDMMFVLKNPAFPGDRLTLKMSRFPKEVKHDEVFILVRTVTDSGVVISVRREEVRKDEATPQQ
jgi:hypothetical protein